MHGLVSLGFGGRCIRDKRPENGMDGQLGRSLPPQQGCNGNSRMRPGADSLAISFGSGNLAGKEQRHLDGTRPCSILRDEAQGTIKNLRGIDEGVAMHDTVSGELGMLQTRDHGEDAFLLREGEVGLEADKVITLPMSVLGAQLQRRPGTAPGCRVGQAHGLERAEPGGIRTGARDLLDRLACLEQILGFEILGNHPLRAEQLLDEGIVFVLVHGGIQVVALTRILVSALAEELAVIERICHDDRCRGIVEGKVLHPGPRADLASQGIGGQGTARDDDDLGRHSGRMDVPVFPIDDQKIAIGQDRLHFRPDKFDIRIGFHHPGHHLREIGAVDGKRTTGRHPAGFRAGKHGGTKAPQLFFQHARGALGLGALQRIGANQFGAVVAMMDGGILDGPHLEKTDSETQVGKAEGCLAAGKPRADDVDCSIHAPYGTRHAQYPPARTHPRRDSVGSGLRFKRE